MQALEGGWVSGDNGRMRAQDLVQVMAEHGVGLTPFVNPVVPLALTIRPLILQACRAGSAQNSAGIASLRKVIKRWLPVARSSVLITVANVTEPSDRNNL